MYDFNEIKTMHALSLFSVGDLRLCEIPVPECKDDEVLIKIKNCGICGSDIGRVFVNGTYHFPTVPGHEFSGQVIYDKKGEWTGKKVAVFPLLPCFKCEMCKKERYAECSDYDYYGSRRDGAFAEYIAVKKFNLVGIPENVSYEEAAMCEPTAVATHALNTSGLKEGQSLLISGAGPIGLIIGQLARSRGAKKVAYIEIDKTKIDFLTKLGFELFDGKEKFDVAIEGTGASAALAKLLGAVSPFSTVVLMGNPGKEIVLSQQTYWKILRGELTLKGIWNSSYAERQNDWKSALKSVSEGNVNLKELITHKVPLEGVFDALKKMRDKTEFFCKVMIDNER